MEQDLHARDRVGVQDFVLLENHTSETEFIENLQKRFKEDLIYVRFSIALTKNYRHKGVFSLTHRHILDRCLFPSIRTRTSLFTDRIM